MTTQAMTLQKKIDYESSGEESLYDVSETKRPKLVEPKTEAPAQSFQDRMT